MSHTVSIEIQFKDPDVIAKACQACGFPAPVEVKDHKFYDSKRLTGLKVELPGWIYGGMVIDQEGKAWFDGDNLWNEERKSQLHRFSQEYGCIATEDWAANEGWMTERIEQDNGAIRVRAYR